MDRRRALSNRSASTEEVGCWSHAMKSISNLEKLCTDPSTENTIGRVNRLISAWPTEDTVQVDGLESAKTTYKKLSSGLHEIRDVAEREVKAIDAALENLDILIALRTAAEPSLTEKRSKRPRAGSPASSSSTSIATSAYRSGSMYLAPPNGNSFSRDPKSRREALAKQLPLQEGRKVAFHPPPKKPGEPGPDIDENTWMLAVVTKSINQDKTRYEVQDADQPGALYNTTLRAIIPLPDPNVPPSNPAHLSAYQEFPAGSTVLALYPDTSCFYRAEVVQAPSDMPPLKTTQKHTPTYKLKFEDDEDQINAVPAHLVVEWPGT